MFSFIFYKKSVNIELFSTLAIELMYCVYSLLNKHLLRKAVAMHDCKKSLLICWYCKHDACCWAAECFLNKYQENLVPSEHAPLLLLWADAAAMMEPCSSAAKIQGNLMSTVHAPIIF